MEGNFHTAFTVFHDSAEGLRASAGWTLRDAIEYDARRYGVEKDAIRARDVSRHVHIQKALRSLTTAEGEQFRLSLMNRGKVE